jgi:hypothetical protein
LLNHEFSVAISIESKQSSHRRSKSLFEMNGAQKACNCESISEGREAVKARRVKPVSSLRDKGLAKSNTGTCGPKK